MLIYRYSIRRQSLETSLELEMAFVVPEEALRGRTSGSHKLQPINARLINSLSTDAAAVIDEIP
eukprot:scaffold33344_cov84-Skeletonema_marinoi.AAC.1